MAARHDTDQLDLVAAADRDRDARHQRFEHLWRRMTPQQRITAMWRGELTFAECLAWAARRPHEVPLIAGEYAFVIAREPDYLGPDG